MNKTIDQMTWDEKAEMALREAVSETIEEHRRLGHPIIIWKDGRVQEIPAEDIPKILAEETK